MNRKHFNQAVIIILVVLNVTTLSLLWLGRPHAPDRAHGEQAAAFLVKELGMTAAQQEAFSHLREFHHREMMLLQEQDRKLHDRFFESLFLPATDTLRLNLLADSIAGTRKQMEMVTYSHFGELTQLLNPAQKEKFRMIFRKALEQVMPPREPLPPPPPAAPGSPPPPLPGDYR